MPGFNFSKEFRIEHVCVDTRGLTKPSNIAKEHENARVLFHSKGFLGMLLTEVYGEDISKNLNDSSGYANPTLFGVPVEYDDSLKITDAAVVVGDTMISKVRFQI